MKALEWLDELSGQVRPEPRLPYLASEPTNCEIVAELIYVNGGSSEVRSVGNVQSGVGVFGRFGLTLTEAILLSQYMGIFQGMFYANDETDDYKSAVMAKVKGKIVQLERAAAEFFSKKVSLPSPDMVKMLNQVPGEEVLARMTEKRTPGGIFLR